MLTIQYLREFGADVETGLSRCVNNEALYLRLVKMVPSLDGFAKLEQAIEAKDYDSAFEAAHGLKGAVGNLSLTPLYNPIVSITEFLRAKTDMDYSTLVAEIMTQRGILEVICKD